MDAMARVETAPLAFPVEEVGAAAVAAVVDIGSNILRPDKPPEELFQETKA